MTPQQALIELSMDWFLDHEAFCKCLTTRNKDGDVVRLQLTPDRTVTALQHLGFKTSAVTKPQLEEALGAALRDGSISLSDDELIGELLSYIVDTRGKSSAAKGAHDDLVIACALAVFGLPFVVRTAPGRTPGVSDYSGELFKRQ